MRVLLKLEMLKQSKDSNITPGAKCDILSVFQVSNFPIVR